MNKIMIVESEQSLNELLQTSLDGDKVPVVLVPATSKPLLEILQNKAPAPVSGSPTTNAVRELLLELGFPPHRAGFRHILMSVDLYLQKPSISFTKALYPRIARAMGTASAAAVERSIRTAIGDAWDHRTSEAWNSLFPYCSAPPTNKQFVATLAQLLQ